MELSVICVVNWHRKTDEPVAYRNYILIIWSVYWFEGVLHFRKYISHDHI
jgi:hypothetical protein